ncbi:MAG: hypothetical protein GY898_26740 [Proteobacteria bacterium]|nr:hypothetical protein [Pseudomonadota bacterium]
MKRYDDKLKRYVEETEASDIELRRVAARLDDEFGRKGSLRQSLLDLPAASTGAEERVLVRLDRTRVRPASLAARLRVDAADPRLAWRAPAFAAMAALLILGVFLLRGRPADSVAPEFAEQHEPAVDGADAVSGDEIDAAPAVDGADAVSGDETDGAPAVDGADAVSGDEIDAAPAVDGADAVSGDEEAIASFEPADLTSTTAWTALEPSSDVGLRFRGAGTLMGSARAPRIAWTRGTVEVEVEPNRGVDLQVQTPEGVVTVVGTAFDVTRDIAGTSVSVRRGKVRVACVEGDTVLLTGGHSITCRPATPAGFLARARHLLDDGGSASATLALVDRGLRDARPGPVHDELLYLRIEQLLQLDRHDEARAAADLYLRQPSRPRSDEVRDLFSSGR